MINIFVLEYPNLEARKNADLAMSPQLDALAKVHESHQTLLVVHNEKIKRKMRSNLGKGEGKLLPPTFTFRSLFNHLSGFTCKAKPVISKFEQAFRMKKAIIESGIGKSSVSTDLIKRCCQARYSWGIEQECPPNSTLVEKILASYQCNLSADGAWDEITIIDHVINELADPNPNPLKNQLRNTFKNIFIDGISSITKAEAKLIENLSNILEVTIWVYEPASFKGQILKAITNKFSTGIKPSVFKDENISTAEANVSLVEVATAKNTPATVAGLIKTELINNKGLAPSDIIVVVSTQEFAISLEEELDRFGIPNSQQARTHNLGDSSIIRLFKWFLGLNTEDLHAKELFSILQSSRMYKMLVNSYRLDNLRDPSLRQLKPKKQQEWLDFWKNEVAPKEVLRRKERKVHGADFAQFEKELLELVDSIGKLFELFSALFENAKGSNPGATLAQNFGKILNKLEFGKWLSPALALHNTVSLVFDKEWESEQLAWHNLKDLMEEISFMPANYFPLLDEGTPDLKGGLNTLIDMVGYKTRANDKTGVQIVTPRNFMGNVTPVVYWLGMNHGEFPRNLSGQVALHFIPNAEAENLEFEAEAIFEQHRAHPSSRFIVVRSQKKRDEIQLPNTMWGNLLKKSSAGNSNVVSVNLNGNLFETNGIHVGSESISQEKGDPLLGRFVEREKKIVKRVPLRVGNEFHGLLSYLYKPDVAFAVTKLEKHFECPFLYFGKTTLGIKDEIENFQNIEFGNLIHLVLESNFVDWKSNPDSRPLYDSVKMTEILNSCKENYKNILEPYFMHMADMVVAAICTDQDFLNLQKDGFVQTQHEWAFILKLGIDDGGKEVLISGKMDAIHEKTQDGLCQSLIEDYKTGKYKYEFPKLAFQSMILQLPLYTHLYATHKAESAHSPKNDVTFRYVFLGTKDKGRVKTKTLDNNLSLQLKNKTEIPAFKIMGDDLGRKVLEEVSSIRKGLIALTPYHPNYISPGETKAPATACVNYCAMRMACRTSEGLKNSY